MSWLSAKVSGYFPFTYIESLIATLKQSPYVRFRSFADLPFDREVRHNTEQDLKAAYREEVSLWRAQVAARETPVIDIILMHDCDSGPKQTVHMCEYEAAQNIVSTTSLFTRRMINNELTPYPIDYDRLLATQKRGICFSYHSNAYQNARYDEAEMRRQFDEDVDDLSARGFAIDHFSPHGGPACPKGLNNNAFFYPAFAKKHLIWTHNRFGPYGERYSDGSLAPRLAAGEPTANLQARLVASMALNTRTFILLHPQYYFSETDERARSVFEASPWVRDFWHWHEKGQPEKYWEPLLEVLPNVRRRSLWYKTRYALHTVKNKLLS